MWNGVLSYSQGSNNLFYISPMTTDCVFLKEAIVFNSTLTITLTIGVLASHFAQSQSMI